MKRILIVARADRLDDYLEIAREYQVAFELNDFYEAELLDDEERCRAVQEKYRKAGIPAGSTMHGAFFDVTIFSNDEQIRRVSNRRMRQSMEIARNLGLRGVVFHTNWNPLVYGDVYVEQIMDRTAVYLEGLLKEYPEIDIYMENMFDASPKVLAGISQRLEAYPNYGVCLDYAHAIIYGDGGTEVSQWIRQLKPYIRHIHINDNNLKQDQHLALGDGQIDWGRFLQYYQEQFADISVLIETTPPELQRRSLEFFRKLEQEPEEVRPVTRAEELQTDELTEKIFWYMNQLIDEKGFSSTIKILTDMGRTLVDSDRASFWYWDVAKKQYWTLAALDSEQIVVPEGTGIVGASIQNNEVILMNEPYDDPRFNPEVDHKTGYVTRSILCIPVTNTSGRVIGAFQAINKRGANGTSGFDKRDVKRLTLAAVYCGKTLESHMFYHEAQVDPLTGLKNRRGFYEYYSDRIRPKLEHLPVSVIMCDIDFFKKVNDTYGHNAGDAVLVNVSDILKQGIRGNGEVVRWGGEEFVLLLPERDLEQAGDLAEELRSTVEAFTTRYEDQMIAVTMSFGVRRLNPGMSADENVERVDAKLYEAKKAGRNRVCM